MLLAAAEEQLRGTRKEQGVENIPENAQPYLALQEGVHLDGVYEQGAAVSDDFAPGAQDGESNA
jgi:hypothetical protein